MESKILSGIVARQRVNSLIKELVRKLIHICSSFVPLLLKLIYWPTIILLGAAGVSYTVCEILRLKGVNIPIISKVTEVAARKRDENKFVLGPVTLVCGILLAALLLPLESSRVGIYALAFGDGLASLCGKMFGKITIPGCHGKTVAGSLACFTAVFISTYCVCGDCLTSLIVGTVAMLIEVLPLRDLDNVIIPIAIGSIYSIL